MLVGKSRTLTMSASLIWPYNVGTRTRVPEFADILRRIAKLAVASKNAVDCGDYEGRQAHK